MLIGAERTLSAMARAAKGPPDSKAALYDRLIATNPSIERKGATNPYTSLNGNMFTMMSADGSLAIRLPAEHREAFIEKYRTGLHEAHGTVLKEYVTVPDELLARTDELAPYLEISFQYAKTLKAKPTKRKRGP